MAGRRRVPGRAMVERLPRYVPGKPVEEVQRELGLADVVKLASNENPLGPSPQAVAAVKASLDSVHLYPEAEAPLLRAALAGRFGLDPSQVVVANGADNVITILCLALLEPGDEVLTCAPTFPFYEHAVVVAGARLRRLPLKDYGYDLDALARAVTPRTRLVFLCNPNNPTGTSVPPPDWEAFLDRLPPGVVVALDEAYAEYADPETLPDGAGAVRAGRPVVVVRTFSKIYGLAGLRVGYCLAPPHLASLLARVREPFAVSRPAQVGALAALEDVEHLSRSYQLNKEGRERLKAGLEALGLRPVPSQANFVLVEVGCDDAWLHEELLRRGVIIRPGKPFGLPGHIRVSVGLPEENERFLSALADVLFSVAASSGTRVEGAG